jgi:hypothetical protein
MTHEAVDERSNPIGEVGVPFNAKKQTTGRVGNGRPRGEASSGVPTDRHGSWTIVPASMTSAPRSTLTKWSPTSNGTSGRIMAAP